MTLLTPAPGYTVFVWGPGGEVSEGGLGGWASQGKDGGVIDHMADLCRQCCHEHLTSTIGHCCGGGKRGEGMGGG